MRVHIDNDILYVFVSNENCAAEIEANFSDDLAVAAEQVLGKPVRTVNVLRLDFSCQQNYWFARCNPSSPTPPKQFSNHPRVFTSHRSRGAESMSQRKTAPTRRRTRLIVLRNGGWSPLLQPPPWHSPYPKSLDRR
jgi:hypothetical protein